MSEVVDMSEVRVINCGKQLDLCHISLPKGKGFSKFLYANSFVFVQDEFSTVITWATLESVGDQSEYNFPSYCF